MTDAPRPNVVLIGFMGTGKTAVGERVAALLGMPFLDTDAALEAAAGRPIARIFAEDGETAFRSLESRIVAALFILTTRSVGLTEACFAACLCASLHRLAPGSDKTS